MRQVRTSPQLLSSATIHGSVIKFVREVEKTVLSADALRGEYYVFFRDRPDFYVLREQLKGQIVTFLRDTFFDEELPSTEIKLNNRTYCSLIKTSTKENALRLGSGPAHVMRLETATKLVCQQLQDVITKKYRKLIRLEYPKILILFNDYLWENCQIRREDFTDLDHLGDFHTVFMIGRDNYVFHSSNPNWI
jgi:hypothetical protein